MARQQLLLLSAIMSMVLFAVVTIPADVRHALNSHQPLSWLVSVVVYAALVAHRRFPLAGAGLQVTREATGQVRPLPEAVELTWPESGC